MDAFPFTDDEWDALKPVAESVLNASLAGDDALASTLRLDMLDLVGGLRVRYGDHPVLLETAADYTEDYAERVSLYRRAAQIAEANGLPTLSIRTALAYPLMALGYPDAALGELQACGAEAAAGGEDERSHWLRLLRDAADYAGGDAERFRVYRRAAEIAAAHGLPTLYIRLCFARHLLDVGQPAVAREELRACRTDLPGADEDERAWWAGLVEEATQSGPNAVPKQSHEADPNK